MVDVGLGESDEGLKTALDIANDAITNGSKNGRAVARRVIAGLTPILLASPDPRIKALALALGIASQVFLGKKQRRISKK